MCFAQDVKALSDVIYHMVEAFHHSLFFLLNRPWWSPQKGVQFFATVVSLYVQTTNCIGKSNQFRKKHNN